MDRCSQIEWAFISDITFIYDKMQVINNDI